jgi:hypothetical protein
MSARDYQLYFDEMVSVTGRKCFVTMATNSIKIHIDRDEKCGAYIWIDPPWIFGRGDQAIESSETCPDYRASDYKERFAAWGMKFEPIFESVIERVEATSKHRLSIFFSHGYELVVPALIRSSEPGAWYDHWYFSAKKPNQPPEPMSLKRHDSP